MSILAKIRSSASQVNLIHKIFILCMKELEVKMERGCLKHLVKPLKKH